MITETDKAAHPWPPAGKQFEFRWREAVWMPVRPWYEANNISYDNKDIWFMALFKSKFPFFTWNIKINSKFGSYGVHGYIGWKPIPVAIDPAFEWNKLPMAQKYIQQDALFVQLSFRPFGIGAIS